MLRMKIMTGVLLAAALSSGDLAGELKGYYPNLSCSALERKLEVDDAFSFFRTVVPFFWDEMKRKPPQELTSLTDLSGFHALCAGDPHPENFGIEARSDGSSVFAINDEDDAGLCPASLDFLKFLVSARLAWGKNAGSIVLALVDSYQRSLMADVPFASDWVNSGLSGGALARGEGSKGHGCDQAIHDPGLTRAIQGAVADFEGVSPGQVSIKEVCDTTKASGGSGGLPRYDVKYQLSSRASHGDLKLQFRGAQASAVSFFTGEDLDPVSRYPLACALEKEDQREGICPVVRVGGMDFLLRRKGDGEDRAVSLKDLRQSELLKVLVDEANALARLHKHTLDRSLEELQLEARQGASLSPAAADYSAAVARVPVGAWDAASQAVVDQVNAAYGELPGAVNGFCGMAR